MYILIHFNLDKNLFRNKIIIEVFNLYDEMWEIFI